MELRRVIGTRRSIRFLLPHRPVERDKIQRMLESARLASHWGNASMLRAIVIERDQAPQEVLDALPSPVGGYQIQLAPVVIVWYLDTAATDQIGTRLRELLAAGAIGYGPNKRDALEKTLVPIMENAGDALKMPGLSDLARTTTILTSNRTIDEWIPLFDGPILAQKCHRPPCPQCLPGHPRRRELSEAPTSRRRRRHPAPRPSPATAPTAEAPLTLARPLML